MARTLTTQQREVLEAKIQDILAQAQNSQGDPVFELSTFIDADDLTLVALIEAHKVSLRQKLQQQLQGVLRLKTQLEAQIAALGE